MSHTPSASASSSRFESIFNSALDAYKIRTKQDLSSHPLLPALQSCDSAGAIITVLRRQIPAFSQSQSSDDSLSKWLVPTVNVLYAFSAVLGEGVGHVNTTAFLPRDLCSNVRSLPQVFSPAKAIFAGMGVLFLVRLFHDSFT